MRLLLGRGDVIAPCKSSDDEDSAAAAGRAAVDLSPATTPRQRKLQHLHLPAVQVGVKKKDEAPPAAASSAAAPASAASAAAAAVAAAKRKDALQVVKARFMKPKGSNSSGSAGGGHCGGRDAAVSPAQPASPTTPRGETPSTPKSAATLARLYNSNKSSSTTTTSSSKAHTPRAAAAAAVKKKAQQTQLPAAATSPTHGATRQQNASVSPRNSPGTPRGALALAPGLQSPERDGRGGAGSRAAAGAAAADRVHARLLAAAEECSSPRVVRRSNLGGGTKRGSSSRSGELNVGSSLHHHHHQHQSSRGHTSSTRSGELGLPGQVGGIHLARSNNNNKSGEIHGVGGRASSATTTTSTGRLLVQGTNAAATSASTGAPGAAPRSPVKLLDRAARPPPAIAAAPAACAPPAPASHQDTSSSSRASGPGAARSAAAAAAEAEASTAARHQQHCQVPDSINLQDLEAGRVTDFDAAGYDLAPGPPLPADAKHTQFWLLNPAPADGDDSRRRSSSFSATSSSSARTSSASSSSASFDPFCIPTGAPAPAPTPSKPHKASNDPNWEALRTTRSRDGALGLTHFRLLKRLGCGDIGSVYLAELRATTCYFAMKVMDKSKQQQGQGQQGRAGAGAEDGGARKKLDRAQTERRILELLDHPFLPTLYAHFDTPHFTCLVMEFCPGGDLHSLRQAQPAKCFSISAARFYAAEVLLALEYLHMMGVVYRDLKPENVLVRTDGHIMLSDFDLSLKCDVNPTLLPTPSSSSSSAAATSSSSSLHYGPAPSSPSKRPSLSAAYSHHVRTLTACIMPVCRMPTTASAASLARSKPSLPAAAAQAAAQAAAPSPSPSLPSSSASSPQQQPPHHLTPAGSSRRTRRHSITSLTSLVSSPALAAPAATHPVPAVQLVAEPTDARSMSFVGTHEYLAPEVISGHGHGSAVDWWTLGVFLYELMYGRTPFRGPDNQATLRNVLTQRLRFPSPADDDLYNSQSDDSDDDSDDDDEQFASEGGDARRRRSLRRQRRRSLSQAQAQAQRWSAEQQQQQQQAAVSLIRGLLTKDPRRRLGSARGAAEIKAHPFFDGVNWALIRCATPPEVPKAFRPPQSVATVGGRTPPPSPAGDGDGGDRLAVAAGEDDGFADVF